MGRRPEGKHPQQEESGMWASNGQPTFITGSTHLSTSEKMGLRSVWGPHEEWGRQRPCPKRYNSSNEVFSEDEDPTEKASRKPSMSSSLREAQWGPCAGPGHGGSVGMTHLGFVQNAVRSFLRLQSGKQWHFIHGWKRSSGHSVKMNYWCWVLEWYQVGGHAQTSGESLCSLEKACTVDKSSGGAERSRSSRASR